MIVQIYQFYVYRCDLSSGAYASIAMKPWYQFLFISFSIILLSACHTPESIVYFQEIDSRDDWQPTIEGHIVVKPGDKLSILVSSRNPELCSIFNLIAARNTAGSTPINSSMGTASGTSGSNGQTSYFTVDPDGNINYPIFGLLHVADLSRSEIVNLIQSRIIEGDYIKDPIVTVEYINMGFTALGEVRSPGYRTFNKDRVTILEAIGLAGDLTINGRRDNILVTRTDEHGVSHAHRIDLRDPWSVYTSPAYYIQQNDVIYVEPNEQAVLASTVNGRATRTPSFWFSLFSFATTIVLMIKNF